MFGVSTSQCQPTTIGLPKSMRPDDSTSPLSIWVIQRAGILFAKGKLRGSSASSRFQRTLEHPTSWVRKHKTLRVSMTKPTLWNWISVSCLYSLQQSTLHPPLRKPKTFMAGMEFWRAPSDNPSSMKRSSVVKDLFGKCLMVEGTPWDLGTDDTAASKGAGSCWATVGWLFSEASGCTSQHRRRQSLDRYLRRSEEPLALQVSKRFQRYPNVSEDILNRSLSHKSQSNHTSSNSSFSSCSACSGGVGSGSFCCSSCILAESAEVAVDAIAAPLLSGVVAASSGVWRACSSQLEPSKKIVSENVECIPPESASVCPQTPSRKIYLEKPSFKSSSARCFWRSSLAMAPRSACASAPCVNLDRKLRNPQFSPSRFWCQSQQEKCWKRNTKCLELHMVLKKIPWFFPTGWTPIDGWFQWCPMDDARAYLAFTVHAGRVFWSRSKRWSAWQADMAWPWAKTGSPRKMWNYFVDIHRYL